jgi:hypothetical protein
MTPRLPQLLLFAAGIGLGAVAARAQSDSAPAAGNGPLTPGTASPPAAAPAHPTPPAPHEISPQATAVLAAHMPKFDPPKPSKPVDELPDLRDIDKPKNQIIRLPKVVVHQERPPIFTTRELNTASGLNDVAMKRYVTDPNAMPSAFAAGLTRFLFQSYANDQYQEDERLRNISSIQGSADMFQSAGDKKESDDLKSLSEDAYLRRDDTAPAPPGQ